MEFLISFLHFVIAANAHADGDSLGFYLNVAACIVWFLTGFTND